MMSRDDAVRRRALGPGESFIVSAPAGSGKTALLAARFLSLMAHGGHGGGPCPPRSILCVTFTEKAAVEMQDRIARALREAKDPSRAPEKEWDRLLFDLASQARHAHGDRPEILDNPRMFRIGTFHGFCAQVARGWPAETGIPPGVPVLSDERQGAALEDAVRRHLRDLAAMPADDVHRGALQRRLAALGNRGDDLVGRLVTLLKKRERLPNVWDLLWRGDLDAAEKHLSGALQDHFGDRMAPVESYFRERLGLWEALAEALRRNPNPNAKRIPTEIPGTDVADLPAWMEVAKVFLTGEGSPRTGIRAQWGFPDALPEELLGFLRGTPPEVAEPLAFFQGLELDPDTATGVVALLDYLDLATGALRALAPEIPGRGLDFLELELGARRALGGSGWPGDPLIFYDAALRHLLVDEAQDLNPTQVDILGLLLEGWEAGDGRTLFMVGDPKQSIYRFRGSEVSLFESLSTRGVHRQGTSPYAVPPANRLTLTSNFRSLPDLVTFSNELFSRIFPPAWDEEADEVPMGRSESEVETRDAKAEVRAALFPFDGGKKERTGPTAQEARKAEARWLAGEVRRITTEKPGESVGILLHRRTHVGVYARAFAAEGVAVRMVEGEKLSERPEVLHLHNLLKALVDPHDDVAWAGVLRAPWCRIPDGSLARMAPEKNGPPGAWRSAVFACDEAFSESARSALSAALGDAGREPPETTLLRAWEALGGPEAVASLYGAAGVANCLRYLELVRECDGLDNAGILGVAEALLDDAYTPGDPAAASSPVQLMTVHQAKGLEFHHVFAPALDYDPFKSDRRHADPILVLPISSRQGPIPMAAVEKDSRAREKYLGYELLAELDKRRRAAEVKRLFYVVCTRARKGLTLTGTPKKAPIPKSKGPHPPFTAPRCSPLALYLDACNDGLDLAPMMPPFARISAVPPRLPIPPPEASLPLRPRPLPYRVVAASSWGADEAAHFVEEPLDTTRTGSARGYGVVLHRMMETLLLGRPAPSQKAVAAALLAAGVEEPEVTTQAPRLLSEALATREDPSFSSLCTGATPFPEWPLEFHDGIGTVVSGRLDLLLIGPGVISVMDFKSSHPRPGQTRADFHGEMQKRYAPQMKNYLMALAALPRFEGCEFRAFLIFPGFTEGRILEIGHPHTR